MAKDIIKPKSNKIKKQKLREKKLEAAKVIVPEHKPVYVIPPKVRNIPQAIEAIYNKDLVVPISRSLGNIARAFESSKEPKFLKEILIHLANHRVKFENSPVMVPNTGNSFCEIKSPLVALINLAAFKKNAIREVKDWKPTCHNTNKQIADFARHLYAKYDVPAFMNCVWYKDRSVYQRWFIHIGQGGNIRTVSDVPLTKKEAHFVMQAPKDFNPLTAIRYGQLVNIGADERFVRNILKSRIGIDFSHPEFWMSVFRWLLANPMLDTAQYAPLIDYIYNQKFVPYRYENGVGIPQQPNLTMKGRDPETLIRQMEEWHRRLGKEESNGPNSWPSSNIIPLNIKEEHKHIVVRELCSINELVKEGRVMNHCVASYANSCAKGRCSIWTMEDLILGQKRLTIEVYNNTISQARKKYNARPDASDMYYLRIWAKTANLSISQHLI